MGSHEELNPHHKRHLLISSQYVDSLLSDIEAILSSALSKSPFPRYRLDITPVQARLIQDYIARIRAQMVQSLKGQQIEPPGPQMGARHSIRVTLEFADIAFDECRPNAMRGYGEVPPSLVAEMDGMVDEMRGVLRKLNTYLAQNSDHDLASRLERLQRTVGGIELLGVLEKIIAERGLVEFRPALSVILDKMESPSFQIAVFGRVSSGKSSLLNHILGRAVLPVGVNPITAVPTRLVYGPEAKLTVTFIDRKTESTVIERLSEFVSEEFNPANTKHVSRIVAELPAPRLQEGVVLVDTPGLGSLATSGAAETLAYLPQCDLGVVLVDAGSTLTGEDLVTVQSLYEAAIPAFVLLSKADLLKPDDRRRSVKYISDQIKSQLDIQISVWPVSTQAQDVGLLDEWFAHEIQPLFDRHQELSRLSLHRKIVALRDSIAATLKIRLEVSGKGSKKSLKQVREAQAQLRRAGGKFEEARVFCFNAADEIRSLSGAAFKRAASLITQDWLNPECVEGNEREVVLQQLAGVASEGANLVYERLQGLAQELSLALAGAGRVLGAGELPAEEEMLSMVREMPRLDPGPMDVRIQRDVFTILGRKITERRVANRLQQQVGKDADAIFHSYGGMLEAWSKKTLAELHRYFDAHADGYRAQLERLTGSGTSGPGDNENLRRDLAALSAFQDQVQTPIVSVAD